MLSVFGDVNQIINKPSGIQALRSQQTSLHLRTGQLTLAWLPAWALSGISFGRGVERTDRCPQLKAERCVWDSNNQVPHKAGGTGSPRPEGGGFQSERWLSVAPYTPLIQPPTQLRERLGDRDTSGSPFPSETVASLGRPPHCILLQLKVKAGAAARETQAGSTLGAKQSPSEARAEKSGTV